MINGDDLEDYYYTITAPGNDMGQIYLVDNRALVVKSSSKVLFMKLIKDEFTGNRNWTIYKEEDLRGVIYFIKGNIRVNITTDKKIFFFKFDLKTLEP